MQHSLLDALQVGLKYGLPTISPVDDAGLFTKEAGPSFQGKSVLGDGNSAVLEALAKTDHLLKVSCPLYSTAVLLFCLQRWRYQEVPLRLSGQHAVFTDPCCSQG